MAGEAAGETLDHLIAFGAVEVGGDHHHDPVALPVRPGGLLPSLADPHLDVRVKQRRVFGDVGHGGHRRGRLSRLGRAGRW